MPWLMGQAHSTLMGQARTPTGQVCSTLTGQAHNHLAASSMAQKTGRCLAWAR